MNPEKWKDKKVLILGFGRSGAAASKFLIGEGAKVTIYDEKLKSELNSDEDIFSNADLICGILPEKLNVANYAVVVVSPGVPPSNPAVKKALSLEIPVISELEVGLRSLPEVKTVAVTGTNGKTTTVELIAYLTGGRMAGNIGSPLTAEIKNIKQGETVVLEVSSYQAFFSPSLAPDIALLLNIFPEHINWHGSFKNYINSKKIMFLRQKDSNYSIFNKNIEDLDFFTEGVKSSKYFFSSRGEVERGVFVKNERIIYKDIKQREELCSVNGFKAKGRHNIENLLAALLAAKLLNIKDFPHLSGFTPAPHRMEYVDNINGVIFINDSKATNYHSTYSALESMEPPVILLMGGRSKGQEYNLLRDLARNKVKKVLAFGESAKEVSEFFKDSVEVVMLPTLKAAVEKAGKIAEEGDSVLLSPGGSSFDEFKDYRERGEKYIQWVREL